MNFVDKTLRSTVASIFSSPIDIDSTRGRFGWKEFGEYYIPYIFRTTSLGSKKFVSMRMLAVLFRKKICHKLTRQMVDFILKDAITSTKKTTLAEAKLLTSINKEHSDNTFGQTKFFPHQDEICPLEEAIECLKFANFFHKRFVDKSLEVDGKTDPCGFLKLGGGGNQMMPYLKMEDGGDLVVPLFYFDGDTQCDAVVVQKWSIAYLELLCRVQGIPKDVLIREMKKRQVKVVNLEAVKKHFPPDAKFEFYWPAKTKQPGIAGDAVTITEKDPLSLDNQN